MAAAKYRCKCKYCKAAITTDVAYKVKDKERTAYFCSQEHYNAHLAALDRENKRIEKNKADKDKVYYLLCEIINKGEIINTLLFSEWTIWNKVATNEKIGQYLEENKDYLCLAVAKIEDLESHRIRYLSAILKNSLKDYKPKPKTVMRPIIQDEYYETKFTSKTRVALEDLEEDCDE